MAPQSDQQATRQSYKERERERREQDILQVASHMMAERGYDNLNMDDLADAVGISKPTLYQHFKNKDDLTAQVVIHSMKMLEDYLAEPGERSAIERLNGTLQLFIEARFAPTQTMTALGTEIILGAIRRNPLVAEHKKRVMDHLQTIVEEGKRNGEIDPDIASAAIVRSIFCLQASVEMMNIDTSSPAALQDAIRSISQIFLHGVSACAAPPPDSHHPVNHAQ